MVLASASNRARASTFAERWGAAPLSRRRGRGACRARGTPLPCRPLRAGRRSCTGLNECPETASSRSSSHESAWFGGRMVMRVTHSTFRWLVKRFTCDEATAEQGTERQASPQLLPALLPAQAQRGATKALLLALLVARFPVPCCAWYDLVVVSRLFGASYESVGRTFESCRAHQPFVADDY